MRNNFWVTISAGLVTSSVQAAVNNWTNPVSAKWESPSWSLGELPASDQTVNIANEGYKAVNVDSTTVANFPSSLTVGSLEVSAPPDAASTLLLNYFGLNTALKVVNSCLLRTNGTLLNLGSSFESTVVTAELWRSTAGHLPREAGSPSSRPQSRCKTEL